MRLVLQKLCGGKTQELKVKNDITCSKLVSVMHQRLNIDLDIFDITSIVMI